MLKFANIPKMGPRIKPLILEIITTMVFVKVVITFTSERI